MHPFHPSSTPAVALTLAPHSGGNFNGMFGEMDSDDTEEEEAEIIEVRSGSARARRSLLLTLCREKFRASWK